jgi:hypothetical protein
VVSRLSAPALLSKESITRCVLGGVFMSDKPFVAEACPPMSHASASNGLSDIETHIKNARCNQPLTGRVLNVHL